MIWTPSKLIPNLQMGDLNRPLALQTSCTNGPIPLSTWKDALHHQRHLQTTSNHRPQVLVKTEKLHPSYTAAGTGAAIMENSLAVPQKVKPRAHITPQFHSSKRRKSTTTEKLVQDYRRSSEGRKTHDYQLMKWHIKCGIFIQWNMIYNKEKSLYKLQHRHNNHYTK